MWLRKAWRYQRDNKKSQNLRMTDNTMTKRKIQKDKQWSTKHYSENKWTRATQTSLKRGCIQVTLEQDKHL